MENEIIEEYTTEEIITEEVFEELPETDDSTGEVSTDNNTDILESVDDISSSYDSTESPSLEELLRNYFSESEEASIRGASDSGSEESSQIDYTEILNDLLTLSEDQATLESSLYDYFETYEENNNLYASVDDISLTNILLLVIFMGILFTATLNFARRIL